MRYFVGDFETSVFKGQEKTEVWASGLAEFNGVKGETIIYNNIKDFMNFLY